MPPFGEANGRIRVVAVRVRGLTRWLSGASAWIRQKCSVPLRYLTQDAPPDREWAMPKPVTALVSARRKAARAPPLPTMAKVKSHPSSSASGVWECLSCHFGPRPRM